MPKTEFSKIQCEIVVEKGDARAVRLLLVNALATIEENCTIFSHGIAESTATLPDHAANAMDHER